MIKRAPIISSDYTPQSEIRVPTTSYKCRSFTVAYFARRPDEIETYTEIRTLNGYN
jgi:hypothetical protein